jgi:hypothetical protein
MSSDSAGRDAARATIAVLVERYTRNRDRYRASTYNEETCRAEFITPLFEALGWDVTNKAGYAEQYKDVIHEEGIKVGDFTKAPDYTFRVAGVRKFFVEAKKPFVDLKNDPAPAYQLRRYAWSAKLPLSVLTDFEEIAVYDTRIRPADGDNPSVARILYLTYDELVPRLDEFWGVFSKDAVLKGSFDRYAEETRGKRGTSEVDAEFLREIEGWRDELARNIAIRNEDLSVDDLNFAVQTTIDRIIFLRIAEGRGAEPYGRLLGLVNAADIYQRLVADYRKADARYNSGLFDFRADRLTTDIAIDDKVLKPILQNLYYPQSPYEFSVLPVEILGNVYEQFLGKVIRLTKGHRAVVEEKPEVKKAGGVYYTPAYIVDYIVKHTVGELCEGRSPKQMEKLRILDPACGSGSFLLRAYQELLERHLAWYREHQPQKHSKEVFPGPGGDWRLTTAEKRRIVLNNIYGVDIDRQAVEVTKLSLLLKILEGENDETLKQHSLFGERALPSLEGNVKCGNSLIAPQDLGELAPDADELRRINPFAWKREFPAIFQAGGFDAVVANPPYLKIEHIPESDRAIMASRFRTLQKRFDTYGLFLELSTALCRKDGVFGFIVPSTLLNNMSFAHLRRLLLEETRLKEIVNLGGRVFKGANNDTLLLFARPGSERGHMTSVSEVARYGAKLDTATRSVKLDLTKSAEAPGYVIQLRSDGSSGNLFAKLKATGVVVGDVARCFQGFVTGGNDAYIVDKETIKGERLEAAVCRPAIFGDQISRYEKPRQEDFVIYLTRSSQLGDYRNVSKRLLPFKPQLEKKREVLLGRQPWWALHWARNEANFERPVKILVQAIRNLSLSRRLVAALDSDRLYADHTINVLYMKDGTLDAKFLLAILNSRVLNYWFLKRHIDINIKGVYLAAAPFPRIDMAAPADRKKHDKLVALVGALFELKADATTARSPQDQTALNRQFVANDESIDRIVYELYGLSPDEIETVEAATSALEEGRGSPELVRDSRSSRHTADAED